MHFPDRRWAALRHGNRASGNVATAAGNLEPYPVGQVIAPSFVNFNNCLFVGLILDRTARTDTRPIKNAHVVELAFRLQQIALTQRLVGEQIGCFFDERISGSVLPNNADVVHSHLLSFHDLVDNLHFVAIGGIPGNLRLYVGSQVTVIEIGGKDPSTIVGYLMR